MVIKELSTKNFRNLEEFKILLSPKLNVIYGDNGSGKTSLLESLHLYWNGKSFRSSSLNDLVASGENDLTLYGKAVLDEVEVPFGVTFDKSTRKRTVKLDGTTIKKSSQLAQLLPTYYFSPSSSYYGSASPGTRRELLFWFMFHVEQQFRSLYGEYKKALSSRNSLLREIKKSGHLTFSNSNLVLSKDFDLQLDFWEQKLAQFNFELYENTKFHLEKFNVLIGSLLPDETPSFLKFDEIKLTKQGLDKITFAEQLKNLRANDIRQGYTSIGFQKIDLFFYKNKKKITGLSRGEDKTLSLVMLFGFIKYITQKEKNTLLMLDDISSELDEKNLRLVLETIDSLSIQCICSVVEKSTIQKYQKTYNNFKMFHVKQGMITED